MGSFGRKAARAQARARARAASGAPVSIPPEAMGPDVGKYATDFDTLCRELYAVHYVFKQFGFSTDDMFIQPVISGDPDVFGETWVVVMLRTQGKELRFRVRPLTVEQIEPFQEVWRAFISKWGLDRAPLSPGEPGWEALDALIRDTYPMSVENRGQMLVLLAQKGFDCPAVRDYLSFGVSGDGSGAQA